MKKLIVKSLLKDRDAFVRRIGDIAVVFEPPVWQHERIYRPHDYQPKMNFPRLVLRTEVKKEGEPAEYMMFSKRHLEADGTDIVNSTTVGNYTEATAIVQQLGFQKVAEIKRWRQQGYLDPKVIVYLDKVEGMDGDFVKIEAKIDEQLPVNEARKKVFEILSLLGQETFVLQTYADLTVEQMQPYLLK